MDMPEHGIPQSVLDKFCSLELRFEEQKIYGVLDENNLIGFSDESAQMLLIVGGAMQEVIIASCT
jgi:hypothetical protein